MRAVVVGGGPSGLYFALLAKKRLPGVQIKVYEQNPRGATYGFGIVLADRGLQRLERADSMSFKAISAASFTSRHRIIAHPDEAIFVEGGGYGGAIARLRLLEILESACLKEGVEVEHNKRIEDVEALDSFDLIVGADGINSVVRRCYERQFGTTSWTLTNRLAWYGTTRHFPYPILSFKQTEAGCFVAAGYAYTERMSTFVPECDVETWTRAGLDQMDEEERRSYAESVFADELGGATLNSNASAWRPLPVVRNREWYVGRFVLIGDALHSAHPTIGSGTRIAMEDAISLVEALVCHRDDIPSALAAFRRTREPAKQKLVEAAEKSFMWYEGFAEKVRSLSAVDFVFDFLTRTGRIDRARLEAEYPQFMTRYGDQWKGTKGEPGATGENPQRAL